jgi:hypothetical protein
MSDPKLMVEESQRVRRQLNGPGLTRLTVEFGNPHHLRDSIAFVRKTGQEAEFLAQLTRIHMMFLVDTMTHDVKVEISPDSPRRPSFAFSAWSKQSNQVWTQQKHVLSGGLIYRDEQGWSLHT